MANIRDVPYGCLMCRDTLHAWEDMAGTDVTFRRVSFGSLRQLTCGHCGSIRTEIVNSLGQIDASTRGYTYSPEYDTALDYSREDCRKERYRRDRLNFRKTADQVKQRSHLRAVN